jgi:hypothetical protein
MPNFLFNPIHGNLKQILAKIDHKYARRNLPEGNLSAKQGGLEISMDFECKIIRMILFSGSEFSKIFGIKRIDQYSFSFRLFLLYS